MAQGPVNVGNIIGDSNTSTDSGNYTYSPVNDPTYTCGIALAYLGFAEASCEGGAAFYFNSINDSGGSGF